MKCTYDNNKLIFPFVSVFFLFYLYGGCQLLRRKNIDSFKLVHLTTVLCFDYAESFLPSDDLLWFFVS